MQSTQARLPSNNYTSQENSMVENGASKMSHNASLSVKAKVQARQ